MTVDVLVVVITFNAFSFESFVVINIFIINLLCKMCQKSTVCEEL